jgi:biopolymer transport protein ExbD
MSASATSDGVNLGIIITPMLDMAFQILAFFIMTYHPSNLEGHIDGQLLPPLKKAAVKGVPNKDKEKEPEDDAPLDPKDAEKFKDTVIVYIKAVQPPKANEKLPGQLREGEPLQIVIKKNEETEVIADIDPNGVAIREINGERRRVLVDFEENALKKLATKLEGLKKGSVAQAIVSLEIDPNLRHGPFVRVWDTCRRSGFTNIGFIPPPPENPSP